MEDGLRRGRRTATAAVLALLCAGTATALSGVLDRQAASRGVTRPAVGRSADQAARCFLRSYLGVVYAASGSDLKHVACADAGLVAQLERDGARVTPAHARGTPHVDSLRVFIRDNDAHAIAQITDALSPTPYPLTFQLRRHAAAGWSVVFLGDS